MYNNCIYYLFLVHKVMINCVCYKIILIATSNMNITFTSCMCNGCSLYKLDKCHYNNTA